MQCVLVISVRCLHLLQFLQLGKVNAKWSTGRKLSALHYLSVLLPSTISSFCHHYITILNSVVSLSLSLKINVEMLLYLWNNPSMCISLMKRIYLDGMKKMIYKKKQWRKH